MASDLILGSLHQLKFAAVEPFLRSLRHTGSAARVHFFVSGVSAADISRIQEYGATVQTFPYYTICRNQPLLLLWPLWRACFARLRNFDARCNLAARVMHLFGIRWVLYYRFLRDHPNDFRRVLVTDVRDVLFQRDPFASVFEPGVHCYLEAPRQLIGQCPYNSIEIRLPFGEEAFRELAQRRVSCAGTTFGDVPSLMRYIETMINLLCTARTPKFDQGTHNYMIYHNLVEDLHLHENGAHAVRTVGAEQIGEIPRDASGKVLDTQGKVVPVLHQYDRHSELRTSLLAAL